MSVEIIRQDAELSHVALSGQMTLMGVERITAEFLTHTAKRGVDTIVDLSGVALLASAGLKLLIICHKELVRQGAKLVLLNPRPTVQKALLSAGMDRLFAITNSLDDALAALGEEGPSA